MIYVNKIKYHCDDIPGHGILEDTRVNGIIMIQFQPIKNIRWVVNINAVAFFVQFVVNPTTLSVLILWVVWNVLFTSKNRVFLIMLCHFYFFHWKWRKMICRNVSKIVLMWSVMWMSVNCLTFSGKYFKHVKEENKQYPIGRSCYSKRDCLGWRSEKFGLPLQNESILDRIRHFGLEQTTFGSVKEFKQLPGFFDVQRTYYSLNTWDLIKPPHYDGAWLYTYTPPPHSQTESPDWPWFSCRSGEDWSNHISISQSPRCFMARKFTLKIYSSR